MTPTYPRSPRGISTPETLNEARWRVTKHQVISVRVVEYQITNRETTGETYRLITTITDWQDALAPTWAAAYHHRREFEIALDEIETHQISHSRVLRWTFPHDRSRARRYRPRPVIVHPKPARYRPRKPKAPPTFPAYQIYDATQRVKTEILAYLNRKRAVRFFYGRRRVRR
jgi:hypothetical protein